MPGPGEPAWTEDDHDKVLAWRSREAGLCQGCRLPLAETTDPANAYAYEGHTHRCFACRARGRAAEPVKEKYGLLVRVDFDPAARMPELAEFVEQRLVAPTGEEVERYG